MPDPVPQIPQPHLRLQPGTPGRRAILHLSFGNLLEIAGAALGCYAVDQLVSLRWALVAGAVCLLIAAEFVYDASVLHVPLPQKPSVRAKVRRWRVRRRAKAQVGVLERLRSKLRGV